jgi:hypothetical protein
MACCGLPRYDTGGMLLRSVEERPGQQRNHAVAGVELCGAQRERKARAGGPLSSGGRDLGRENLNCDVQKRRKANDS